MTLTRLSLCVLISMVLELYGQSVRTTFGYNCHEYAVYKLLPAERPKWNESRNLCSESGSHLVCIEHQQEINFLARKLEELKLESEYFIGLDKQNEKWTWICNRSTVVTPKKRPWAIHQPSGSGPCAKMYFVREYLVFEDIPCDVRKDYICERRNSSCHKKAEPDIDEKETIKPTTIHTLPDVSVATDSVITTRQQHEGDYTTNANSSSMSSVTAFIPKKGKPSHIPWMIAALLGWTVVIFLSFWLWLRKAPRKEDSASGDVEADVTSMNLTDIRSQMSEQEGGYAALNMHRMMCPNSATYTSLVYSGQESSAQGPGSCMESHLQEGARKDVLSENYEII
ncbi:uncharacterized protein [Montipora foliosa]|uniref:uncharacterized protein n=1 Tax=Montipora foliosa TaxID=591990 RepID=UPI0035F158AD